MSNNLGGCVRRRDFYGGKIVSYGRSLKDFITEKKVLNDFLRLKTYGHRNK